MGMGHGSGATPGSAHGFSGPPSPEMMEKMIKNATPEMLEQMKSHLDMMPPDIQELVRKKTIRR